MKLNKWIVPILAIITALESLSIDLYLPAFSQIASDLQTNIGNVQISVSVFLLGFAIGQLFWGPLSDKYGRKPVLLSGLSVFIISSFSIVFVNHIELLWTFRFLQSFGGCAGIVMSRTIIADVYDRDKAIKIFSTQAQISGIAPIIAPLIGSFLIYFWHWESIFFMLGILGILCLASVVKWIPETNVPHQIIDQAQTRNTGYLKSTLQNRQFLIYTLIGAMAYSSLMIYISTVPFVLMTKGGLSESTFSLAFGFNSVALIIASYVTPKLSKIISSRILVFYSGIVLSFLSLLSLLLSLNTDHPVPTILLLFLSLIPIGILFPLTTALSLSTITKGKGIASAVLGFSQLMLSFIFSGAVGLFQTGAVWPIEMMRLLVGIIAVILAIIGIKKVLD